MDKNRSGSWEILEVQLNIDEQIKHRSKKSTSQRRPLAPLELRIHSSMNNLQLPFLMCYQLRVEGAWVDGEPRTGHCVLHCAHMLHHCCVDDHPFDLGQWWLLLMVYTWKRSAFCSHPCGILPGVEYHTYQLLPNNDSQTLNRVAFTL